MIPYDLDPSLHATEPQPRHLEDGFSPSHGVDAAEALGAPVPAPVLPIDPAVAAKSDF